MKNPKTSTIELADKRIWEIDFLRGVLIIGMVIDHFMFFLGMFSSLYAEGSLPIWLLNVSAFANAYWLNEVKILIRFFGVALFFLLTGISSKFSKSNLKRSVICMAFGIALALGYMAFSLISGQSMYVLFGIITCLGFSMFAYWAAKTIYTKIHKSDDNWKWWALGIGCIMALAGLITNLCISTDLKFGHILLSMFGHYNPGYFDSSSEQLTFGKALLTIIGFHKWGNDWMGILPFTGFTFLGGFIGEHCYSIRKSIFFRKNEEKNVEFNRKAIKSTWLINWLGARTFIIYIIHPVIIVLLMLIVFSISAGSWPNL